MTHYIETRSCRCCDVLSGWSVAGIFLFALILI